MGRRLVSSLALLGILLAVAVGQGLTLTRCLLTGQVMLSCCCGDQAAPQTHNESTADEPDFCCSFEHLRAGWPTTQNSSRADRRHADACGIDASVHAPFLFWLPLPRPIVSGPIGESPPIWRSMLRV
jgi:hypothetical protein